MEQVLCEPVELTEFELDAVAGGAFNIDVDAAFSDVDARIRADFDVHPDTDIQNLVDNSFNIH